MGLYIQCGTNKVQWCMDNGKALNGLREASEYMMTPELGSLVVCVVDNISFQSAAVMHSMKAFNEEANDPRPKYWFLMREAAIRDFCPEWAAYA